MERDKEEAGQDIVAQNGRLTPSNDLECKSREDAIETLVAIRKIVYGIILSRRSFGRSLAFCEIELHDDEKRIVKFAFRRATWAGTDSEFPCKKSAMPFGAAVQVTVDDGCEEEPWTVLDWRVHRDPRKEALLQSKVAGSDEGVSCEKYLRNRREAFEHASAKTTISTRESRKTSRPPPTNVMPVTAVTESDDNRHGDPHAKGLRAKVFADWAMENVLRGDGTDRVLDVAGGKGDLSMHLAKYNIPCTVIDPLVRKRPKMKALTKASAPIPVFAARCFSMHDPLLDDASSTCLLGLHPDQCTETILDAALVGNKAVALVPCCVFPSFFPSRRLGTKSVTSYEDFIIFLLQKDSRLRLATLPIAGKNKVIYLLA